MTYRQRLIDAAEAAEKAEKLEYVRVHKSCLEKLKAENARLREELAALKRNR